jgi:hypothetical protein
MPYFENENAKSGGAKYGHEEAVAVRIKDAGFVEIDKSLYPKITKGMLKKWARSGNDADLRSVTQGMPVGTYILQPSGSQGFPDVLVLDHNNRFVAIECKSSKAGFCPMWNDSLPNPNSIYVLSSGKLDETTVFMGKDVITDVEVQMQIAFWKDQKLLEAKYRDMMKPLDTFNRGWDIRGRPQNFQGGGGEKTNYFKHFSRAQCEKNTLEYASQ